MCSRCHTWCDGVAWNGSTQTLVKPEDNKSNQASSSQLVIGGMAFGLRSIHVYQIDHSRRNPKFNLGPPFLILDEPLCKSHTKAETMTCQLLLYCFDQRFTHDKRQ
jgi:hypothetical protein